jgi:hypothetical protein
MRIAYLVFLILAAAILLPPGAAFCRLPGADQVIDGTDTGIETAPTTIAADTTPPTAGPARGATLREREAADKLEQERTKSDIETNIYRLTRCVGGTLGCVAHDFPRMVLGLTRSEVEALLGPPQYQLHLAGNHLYYWTVPLRTNRTVAATRVQLIFGDCYYREKNSRKKAVCEAALH